MFCTIHISVSLWSGHRGTLLSKRGVGARAVLLSYLSVCELVKLKEAEARSRVLRFIIHVHR